MLSLQKTCHFLCLVFFSLNVQANLSSSSCSQDEGYALIQFKSSFTIDRMSSAECDTAAFKSYPKTDSWKQGTDCCSWDGVTCDNITSRVIGLDLNCSWLHGTIHSNSSLFHLPHLQKLNLAHNHFNFSKMSSKFGEFANLVYLNLSESVFTEQVPSQVSHLSKLVSLDLSMNELTLDKHTLEGLVHNLTEVTQLFLGRTNMYAINPDELMNLSSSLSSLSLFDCGLRGKFPENIFHMSNLKMLYLGRNVNLSLPKSNWSSPLEVLDLSNAISFVGGFPDSIGNLISLKHLDAYGAQISGAIPKALGNLSKLNYLDLSENYLSGQIPSSFIKNLSQLQYLSLSDNQLEGSIPDEVSAFPNLISLDLSSNLLNGTLPPWLYTIPSLQSIDLYSNQFTGPIPSSISQLLNLTHLHLSSNNLSGIVEFGMFSQLQSLEFLDLSFNSLSLIFNGSNADYTLPNLQLLYLSFCNVIEFPQFLRDSKSLQYLDLSNNRIYGKIPEWMGKNSSLSYLNLSHNFLTDVDQELLWKKIETLDLSSNLIHGNLPIPPLMTQVFFISGNTLSGEIPSLICNLSFLGFLDVSHNNLSGIIPPCFGNLSKSAEMLNLRMNKLHGIIPTFAKGCQLRNLNLNGNQIEGTLTRSIRNCRSLEVIDLGNNKIKGKFPLWLGSLPQLEVLVLGSNQLHGSIRDTRSTHFFSKIQIFDLSNNCFTGPLPVRFIENFKAMVNLTNDLSMSYMGLVIPGQGANFYSYSIQMAMKGVKMDVVKIFIKLTSIDLSNNMFEGEIPKVIGKLDSLKGLNLSHNNLSGCIPTSIGSLSSLEWLDLSTNKLNGTIPETLLDVASLSTFNVSENQLEGQIPQGKQFNTFGIDSYQGNKGLCGFPVSKGCSNSEPPSSILLLEDGSESNITFGWKVVLLGYGCGVIFGLEMGYVVFQTGKPKCFVALVEDRHLKRRNPSKIGNQRGGRRRI